MTGCLLVVTLAEQEGQIADPSSTSLLVPGWQGGHPGRGDSATESTRAGPQPGSPKARGVLLRVHPGEGAGSLSDFWPE